MIPARSPLLCIWVLLIAVVSALVAGCGFPLVSRHIQGTSYTPHPRVAVLPFENYTDQDLVSAKVTEYVQSTMTARAAFTMVESGTTFEALRRLRIRSALVLRKGQIDSLAQALEADYLLAGSVLEYREIGDKFLDKIPQVSINARLVDCKSGATVWTGVSNDSGDRTEFLFGIGAVQSADELSRKMVESMVTDIEKLFR
jgi:TolB-like protein